MLDFLTDSKLIHDFCDAHGGESPCDVLKLTSQKMNGLVGVESDEDKIRHVITQIETTPAYDDRLADAKLRLRLLAEEAYMTLYPATRSVMGLKF